MDLTAARLVPGPGSDGIVARSAGAVLFVAARTPVADVGRLVEEVLKRQDATPARSLARQMAAIVGSDDDTTLPAFALVAASADGIYVKAYGAVDVRLQGDAGDEMLSGVGSFIGVDRELRGPFHTVVAHRSGEASPVPSFDIDVRAGAAAANGFALTTRREPTEAPAPEPPPSNTPGAAAVVTGPDDGELASDGDGLGLGDGQGIGGGGSVDSPVEAEVEPATATSVTEEAAPEANRGDLDTSTAADPPDSISDPTPAPSVGGDPGGEPAWGSPEPDRSAMPPPSELDRSSDQSSAPDGPPALGPPPAPDAPPSAPEPPTSEPAWPDPDAETSAFEPPPFPPPVSDPPPIDAPPSQQPAPDTSPPDEPPVPDVDEQSASFGRLPSEPPSDDEPPPSEPPIPDESPVPGSQLSADPKPEPLWQAEDADPPPPPSRDPLPAGDLIGPGDTSDEPTTLPPTSVGPGVAAGAFTSQLLGALDVDEPESRPPLPVDLDPAEVRAPDQDAHEVMVQGVICSRGHFNDPRSRFCSSCGISMVQNTQVLTRGPRPPLGVMVFEDGATFSLSTDYVVGRQPEVSELVLQGLALPLTVKDPERSISRAHAELRLVEWDVHLVNLSDTNGSFVWDESQGQWVQIPAGQSVVLTPGLRVALGRRSAVFESSLVR